MSSGSMDRVFVKGALRALLFGLVIALNILSSEAKKALLSSQIASAVCGQLEAYKEAKEMQPNLMKLPPDVPVLTTCDGWTWNKCAKGETNCGKIEHEKCGDGLNKRVLGGVRAAGEEFPWDVSIRFIYDWGSFYPEPRQAEDVMKNDFTGLKEAHRCTGTLYSPQYIITSGWCAHRGKEYIVTKNRFVAWISRGVFLDAKIIEMLPNKKPKGEILVHPEFDPDPATDHTKDHDIALLKMPKPFKFTKNVYALEVAAVNKPIPAGTKATFTGWGTTTEAVVGSQIKQAKKAKEGYGNTLFKIELTVVEFKGTCEELIQGYLQTQNTYDPNEDLSLRYLCAKAEDPDSQGACGGDLGGPLICTEGTKQYMCGLRNSWGIATHCPTPDNLEIFLRTSFYLPWLEATAGKQNPKHTKPN